MILTAQSHGQTAHWSCWYLPQSTEPCHLCMRLLSISCSEISLIPATDYRTLPAVNETIVKCDWWHTLATETRSHDRLQVSISPMPSGILYIAHAFMGIFLSFFFNLLSLRYNFNTYALFMYSPLQCDRFHLSFCQSRSIVKYRLQNHLISMGI